MSNTSLQKAKRAKNDEFYTQYGDIEKELKHYAHHFKGKVVYCNCDNPEWSNFVKFFKDNFDALGLKGLLHSHYDSATGAGDFRSLESIALLKQADIVVSNPPFSLFREYISQLVGHDKKFLVIGGFNAVKYKDIFPLIRDNKLWLGVSSSSMKFILPDGSLKGVFACWFTNLPHSKQKEKIHCTETYTPEKYPKYDNYDAINVDKVNNIPKDYKGNMGVPISFLEKLNPDQFDLVDCLGCPVLACGKKIYTRFIIKHKEPQES